MKNLHLALLIVPLAACNAGDNALPVSLDDAANFVILTKAAITLRTGATVDGRARAQTAVALDGATAVEPAR